MWRIYRIYLSFLVAYKWRVVAFGVITLAVVVATNIQPYFLKLFTDNLLAGNLEELKTLLLMLVGIRFGETLLRALLNQLGDWVMLPASRDARMAVFKKVQELDFAYHLSKSTGALISAFKRGDGAFFNLTHTINMRLTQLFLGFLIILFILVRANATIALLIGVSFLINLLVALVLIKTNIRARREFNESEDEISGIITDNLINYETVKLFAKEGWEQKRLGETFVDWLRKLWRYANSFRLIDITVGTLGNIGMFLVMWYALGQFYRGTFSPGDFVMVFGYISSFYPRFYEVVYEMREIAKHYIDLQKYLGILELKTKVSDPEKAEERETVKGEIEFRRVSFSYPGGKKGAVKNINLIIRQGQSVALVGRSGVGKTTLVKLLMRFYDPDAGEIMLDGINIKNFKKSQLRSFMGVVPQEPVLFNNTIKYNIAYGAENVSEQEIEAAAKMANLDDFIKSLPKGYETHVGERGVKLSGGQKQRLAIARMILSDPDIIIFDEATSQLDSESERKIQDAFWKAAENKTTIIIAHRLSTVARADKIVVLRGGRISEVGSHRELLQREESLYSKFWKLQSIN